MKIKGFILLVIIALVGLGYHFANRKSEEGVPVLRIVRPERRTIEQEVVLRGTVAPILRTEIRSEISGRISNIAVTAGSNVRAGQILIELDQRAIRAELGEADLRIEASALRAAQAEKDLERRRRLAAREYINSKEYQDAETEMLLAKNSLAAERARRVILEERLSKTTITAPYDAVVLSVEARPGMVVTGADSGREGPTLMEVADLSRLRIEAQVTEMDAARLTPGRPVEINYESLPEVTTAGEISFVSPAGKKNPGSNDDVRYFPIEIDLKNVTPEVKPGMTAKARIVTRRREDVLSLEIPAVFFDSILRKSYVYARDAKNPEQKFERRTVETGLAGSTHIEILTGLDGSEEISLVRPAWDSDAASQAREIGRSGR